MSTLCSNRKVSLYDFCLIITVFTHRMPEIALPLSLFSPVAALAGYFIFGHFFASGIQDEINSHCSLSNPDNNPYRLLYTPFGTVNEQLCGVVSTFQAAMVAEASLFLNSFAVWFAPLAFFILAESCRHGRSILLSSSLVVGLLYQIASAGVVLSLYWMLFLLVGAQQLHRGPNKNLHIISQGWAEAIAFAFIVGSVIPTVAMIMFEDPYVTAIWQLFPVWTAIAASGHHFFRPSSRLSYSGYTTIRTVYLGIFLLSSSYHVATIWPLYGDLKTLQAIFLPSLRPISPSSVTHTAAIHHLLQYDAIFSLGSTVLATIWFTANLRQMLILIVWYTIGIGIVGPGATISAVMLWRESTIAERTGGNDEIKIRKSD